MNKTIFKALIIIFLSYIFSYLIRTSILPKEDYVNFYVLKIAAKLFLTALTLIFISKRVNTVPFLKNNRYIIPIVVILFYLSISHVVDKLEGISSFNNIVFFSSCLSVAIFEEFVFRKYIYQEIRKKYTGKSIMYSVVMTSLFFGLAHASNFFNSEVVKISVIVQIVLAFGLGMLFQSLVLRFKSIILVIGLHAIINYLGTYKSKLLFIANEESTYTLRDFLFSFVSSVILVVILSMISYWLLRPLIVNKK